MPIILTTNTLFGKNFYNKTGTSSFQRATSTHDLQQVEMACRAVNNTRCKIIHSTIVDSFMLHHHRL